MYTVLVDAATGESRDFHLKSPGTTGTQEVPVGGNYRGVIYKRPVIYEVRYNRRTDAFADRYPDYVSYKYDRRDWADKRLRRLTKQGYAASFHVIENGIHTIRLEY